jgi:hypothetical protein
MCQLHWTAKKAVYSSNVIHKNGGVEGWAYSSNTSAWTSNQLPKIKLSTSDERLKENVVGANLDLCYDNVRNLPLVYYKWRDNVHSDDRHRLGWIAQDVEKILPKAVKQQDLYGYTDCRLLNETDLLSTLFGAVKKLQELVETQACEIRDLTKQVSLLGEKK